MQWVALEDGKRVLAQNAKKSTLYVCPECLNSLRMRSGPHRRPHFYHIEKNFLCRQHGKTAFHLETQLAIQKALPRDEGILEASFPTIHRIADVAWPAKKIIFEVQCSPITCQEVQNRIKDYESIGFHVVWILHERRYNQRRLSAAEEFLAYRLCYFSSIDARGKGELYDQFNVISGAKRLFRGLKLPIDLSLPYSMEKILPDSNWPNTVIKYQQSRCLGFKGDLLDRVRKSSCIDWETMRRYERYPLKQPLSFSIALQKGWGLIKGIYSSFLHALLEKHSI